MPGITGMGTTFDLPSFVGDLFTISPDDTPLLASIGGLTGGREASDVSFEWQFYDLRDPADRQRLEGADAPDPSERVRQNADNVVEIHQEAVSVSYTRQSVGAFSTSLRGVSPVTNELAWQIDTKLKEIARDVNRSFIVGTYAKPVDNASPRRTRGLLEAIVTNVEDGVGISTAEELFKQINDLAQICYQNGGLAEGDTRTILCGPSLKRYLSDYQIDKSLQPPSRNVGGVNLTTVVTDFGTFNVMLDRAMPLGTLALVSLEQLAPRFLLVPGKGHFFTEPLAKTGSRDEVQLYGEIGLEYGNERAHGKIVDIASPYDAIGVGSGSGS